MKTYFLTFYIYPLSLLYNYNQTYHHMINETAARGKRWYALPSCYSRLLEQCEQFF